MAVWLRGYQAKRPSGPVALPLNIPTPTPAAGHLLAGTRELGGSDTKKRQEKRRKEKRREEKRGEELVPSMFYHCLENLGGVAVVV